MAYDHKWVKSKLGHEDFQCSKCLMTDLEAQALGLFKICDMPDEEYKCWVSDWFMASRNDAKEYHCSKIGFSEQCGYCANRDYVAISFITIVKED